MNNRRIMAGGALLLGLALAGCQNEGPGERAGKDLDRAAQDVKNTVSPPGPLEKAGQNVDRAVNP